MESEDAYAQTFLGENLNGTILKTCVPEMDFKGFMMDSSHEN